MLPKSIIQKVMNEYLIVVDMQNDFIDGALGTPEAEMIVSRVEARIKKHLEEKKGPVIFTLDTHSENYMDTAEGKKLPVPHCIKGTTGWKLHPALDAIAEKENCRIIEKPIFGSAELGDYLTEQNEKEKISAVELIGLCTDICVISNAMIIKSHIPEVPVRVVADCCAGVTPDSHDNALSAMQMCQIDIV